MSLEFYTNEELIDELKKRETFAGLIVYSPKNVKKADEHEEWCLAVRNLTPEQVMLLFEEFGQRI